MGLFDKLLNKDTDNGDGTLDPDIVAELDQSAAAEDSVDVADSPETPALVPEESGGDSADAQEQPATEDEADPVDQLEQDEQGVEELDLEDEPEADSEDEDGDGDELMDIFTGEEEEDVDLSAMTGSLEEVDVEFLLAEAGEVSARLRERIG